MFSLKIGKKLDEKELGEKFCVGDSLDLRKNWRQPVQCVHGNLALIGENAVGIPGLMCAS